MDALKTYAEEQLKIGMPALMALGRRNPDDKLEPFNMAYLGIRGAGAVNGVSRLHGAVSRRLFQVLFPRRPRGGDPDRICHQRSSRSYLGFRGGRFVCGRKRSGQERWRGSLEYVEEQIRLRRRFVRSGGSAPRSGRHW